jgi:hypothetical protein
MVIPGSRQIKKFKSHKKTSPFNYFSVQLKHIHDKKSSDNKKKGKTGR